MNTLRGCCVVLCVCAPLSLANDGAFHPPMRLEGRIGSKASAEQVFDAFHTIMAPLAALQSRIGVPMRPDAPAIFPDEFRTIDGSGNNLTDPTRGMANTPFLRNTTIGYADGKGTPGGVGEQGPREISNLVVAQATSIPNVKLVTDFLWQWGQFIDHDMSLTPFADPTEEFDIPVPACDPQFDPDCTGTKVFVFKRSAHVEDVDGVRQQLNANTSFIDASMVYGSDQARADELRAFDGLGHLKTSTGNLLPFNVNGFPNQPNAGASFFLAGDVRANETQGLCALQTLFMREHNFQADQLHAIDPTLDDDQLYFRARAIVGAEIEVITYKEFLPNLLGKDQLSVYAGYNPDADPRVANVHATAAYRLGHTLLSPILKRLDADGQSLGDLTLDGASFRPGLIISLGIEPYLRGLASQQPQAIDPFVVDAMRNFGAGGPAGFDLAALNIQRGRDHGLPSYNQVRLDYGLRAFGQFSEITDDVDIQAKLAAAYATPGDIEIWVGALAEKRMKKNMLSQTTFTIVKDQFERVRDGDRFWYEVYFDSDTIRTLDNTRLSTIIKRNTTIADELQARVFRLP